MDVFVNYFWIFILGSFMGFILESIWCLIRYKKLESRKGLIYGWFIPIYGIATMLINFFISVLKINNYFLFFILTFIICGIVEYLSSLFQEKCFGTRSWDYSSMVLNLHGRVNLIYLLAWSIMGVFWCRYSSIILNLFIDTLIKTNLLYEITTINLIFMIYNSFISFMAVYRQRLRRNGIMARNKYELWLDNKFNDARLSKIYANSRVIKEGV